MSVGGLVATGVFALVEVDLVFLAGGFVLFPLLGRLRLF